jgi:tRNA threonylcarbamoyladenosine biosynthesis protein TsaE
MTGGSDVDRAGEVVDDVVITSADAMHRWGVALASVLRPGDLVILTGPLGAGKTTLTQGIGAGLGVRAGVSSPTFVIARTHPALGSGPALVHVDAYRLQAPSDIDDLDLDASLTDSVTVVEWGSGLVEQLNPDRLELRIHRVADPQSDIRRIDIVRQGSRWSGVNFPKGEAEAEAEAEVEA